MNEGKTRPKGEEKERDYSALSSMRDGPLCFLPKSAGWVARRVRHVLKSKMSTH